MSEETWTRADLARLKTALAKAKAEKKEVFKFDGNDVLVEHVENLIPRIEAGLKGRR